jgi:hypothetical protein
LRDRTAKNTGMLSRTERIDDFHLNVSRTEKQLYEEFLETEEPAGLGGKDCMRPRPRYSSSKGQGEPAALFHLRAVQETKNFDVPL